MNKVIRVDRIDGVINITCHTDGDPAELFWVWELTDDEIQSYGIEDFTEEVADEFVNDQSLLIDSDYYEGGKEPIYGCWYAPLTMEQIERSFL